MILLQRPADWIAPHRLVVGFLRVTTEEVSFHSPAAHAPSFAHPIARVARVASDPTAVRLELDDGARFLLLSADPREVARAIGQACRAREARAIYR